MVTREEEEQALERLERHLAEIDDLLENGAVVAATGTPRQTVEGGDDMATSGEATKLLRFLSLLTVGVCHKVLSDGGKRLVQSSPP